MTGHRIQISAPEAAAYECAPGDTILASALRSGLAFPYECNSGGCGSCQFELLEGEVEDLWPEAPGISDRQRGRGRRLACQSVACGDVAIKVALAQGEATITGPAVRELTFIGRRDLTADMAEFSFTADGAAQFLPGQFAMLQIPGIAGPRAYSMSNTANAEGELRFIVKRVPGGKGTAFLFDRLMPGATIRSDGPFGKGYLRMDNARDIVCIAGGSGLSPIMSILKGIDETPALSERRVLLFYGVRGPADACVEDMLSEYTALHKRVELHIAVSDDSAPGAAEWTGARGMIHEIARAHLGEDCADYEFYFCGPPPMTDAVHRMLLLEARVPADQLHFDRFY